MLKAVCKSLSTNDLNFLVRCSNLNACKRFFADDKPVKQESNDIEAPKKPKSLEKKIEDFGIQILERVNLKKKKEPKEDGKDPYKHFFKLEERELSKIGYNQKFFDDNCIKKDKESFMVRDSFLFYYLLFEFELIY